MALAINGVTQRRSCCATLPLLPRLRTRDEKAVNKVKTTLNAKYHSPSVHKDIQHLLKVAISIGIVSSFLNFDSVAYCLFLKDI